MEVRKDVGILAMDIFFPPTCVQQVRRSPPAPIRCVPHRARLV